MKRMLPFLAAGAILLGQGCFTPFPETPSDAMTAADDVIMSDTQSPDDTSMTDMTDASTLAFPGVLPESETKKTVRIDTPRGEITIELLPDQGPNAASNFVYLVKQGFFNGLTFHRREEGFVIQGGDPLGNGLGGPGYQFADDPVKPVGQNPQITVGPAPDFVTYRRGTVAMANAGANTNGSQFFIMLGDKPLPPAYSIFGRVTSGMDAVDAIRMGDRMTQVTVE